MDIINKVYEKTKKIPKGRVSTYGDISKAIFGNTDYSRAVGRALNKNCNKDIPCHRVVQSNGKLGGYRRGVEKKIEILSKEGIEINKSRRIVKNLDKVIFRF